MPRPKNLAESGGPGGRIVYVQSPIDPTQWLCWCGQLHPTEPAAAGCRHIRPRLPVIPEDVTFSMGGGLGYGGELGAQPERVELPAVHQFTSAERRRAGIGGVIILVAWCLLMAVLVLVPAGSDDPGPVVTPATYGPSGPNGGPLFTSMPGAR